MGLPPPSGVAPGGRPKWPEEKLYIGLDSLRNFNVRAKTVGPGVSFRPINLSCVPQLRQ